jgi:uncharacterized membrane protein
MTKRTAWLIVLISSLIVIATRILTWLGIRP